MITIKSSVSENGIINIMSLRSFLKRVPRKHIGNLSSYKFSTLQDLQDIVSQCSDEAEYPCDYKHFICTLQKPKAGLELEILKVHLLLQASVQVALKQNLQDLIEHLAIEHLSEFGLATACVRVGPRKWFIADPEDFCYYINDSGQIGLGCIAQARTKIYDISRITKEQAQKLIDTYKNTGS